MSIRVVIQCFILILSVSAIAPRINGADKAPIITHVLIRTTEKGYTVYFGLSDQINKSKFEAFKKKTAGKKNMQIIDIGEVVKNPEGYFQKYIKEDHYSNIDVATGLSELIKRGFASDGLGLTWNGGIALTRNDFNYAEKTYRAYLVNPKAKNLRAKRNLDPVHPNNHLRLLDEAYMKKLSGE